MIPPLPRAPTVRGIACPRIPVAALLLAGGLLALLPGCAPTPTPAQGEAALPGDELRVTFLHTSDEHSALVPLPFVDYHAGHLQPTRGGFARLATAVERIREGKAGENEPVLLTSAGDYVSGSLFSWLILAGEAPELGPMVELGYDVVTLGNHEFDYGAERLAGYLRAAGFPAAGERTALVATNTRPPAGHPLAARGIQRTHLRRLPNGLRIGFLGLLGQQAAGVVTMAAPVEFAHTHAAAAEAVEELRAAGAHLVVAITHAGIDEDRELARAVAGIDLILGGHNHLLLEEPAREGSTLIVHPGAHLEQLVQLELGFSPASGELRVRNAETGTPYVVPLHAGVPESPWMAGRVAALAARLDAFVAELSAGRLEGASQVVARADFILPAEPGMAETPLGSFAADAVRRAAERATGVPVDFAFQASGMVRADLAPGSGSANRGEVSFYDLGRALGMGFGPDSLPGYPLVSVWLTGEEVRRVLEVSILLSGLRGRSYYQQVSGLRARYDRRRALWGHLPFRGTPLPAGRAVLRVERQTDSGFVPLERGDERLYHVVTDLYVASFLPMVGRVVPGLAMVPKDREGDPIVEIEAAIVRRDGAELKVWQAALEYARAQPPGREGEPQIAARYAAPEGRLVQARGTPLLLWPSLGLLALSGALVALLYRRRRRRAAVGR
jgi:5'-nucleotidase / UDP-sugar diphosphatase